jgi:hypothetical protein
MSNYTVYYSDPAKYNYPITILDGTLNQQATSITLLGQNYGGNYGGILATDLVHMLENFANAAPPNNPIEGQLWFDNSDPNNKVLRINDGGSYGSQWRPVNGIFQQGNQPTNVQMGDIWVDTIGQQLSIYNGASFTLVGPNYSSATRTGSYPTSINDINNGTYTVIINYVNDNAIEIIATESFIPNPVINGFENGIYAGVNISQANVGTLESPVIPQINGTANSANRLQVSLPYPQSVPGDTFLRKDIDQQMTGALTVAHDSSAILIGTDPTFILQRLNQYNATFYNAYAGGASAGEFNFKFYNGGLNNTVLSIFGDKQSVGINLTTSTSATLDVNGDLKVATSGTFNTVRITSPLSDVDHITNNALIVDGGVGVGGTLVVTGEHILNGTLVIGTDNDVNQTAILPYINTSTTSGQPGYYRIGNDQAYWGRIYTTYVGLTDNSTIFLGRLEGPAQRLATSSTWRLSGDISSQVVGFNGQQLTQTFNTTISSAAFTSKATAPVIPSSTATVSIYTTATDTMLLYRPNTTTVYQQTKAAFLQDINYLPITPTNATPGSLVPTGTVIPFAAPVIKIPSGWILCDGAAVSRQGSTKNLWDLIGTLYGSGDGTTTFNVPTLTQLATNINYIIKT